MRECAFSNFSDTARCATSVYDICMTHEDSPSRELSRHFVPVLMWLCHYYYVEVGAVASKKFAHTSVNSRVTLMARLILVKAKPERLLQ